MATLRDYVYKFNSNDEEAFKNLIDNDHAYDFLSQNAPKLTCPDSDIEETFAFRTWTYRKHIRIEDGGWVVSEFLPEVPWADKGNTISAAFPFHLDEAKWFACSKEFIFYIDFMLKNKGNPYHYYVPAIPNIVRFLTVTGNEWYIKDNINLFEDYFKGWEDRHLLDCGLYYSEDWCDAMEFSISGTTKDNCILKGVRPTLNSYMYENSIYMAKIERDLGRLDKADFYQDKANKISTLVEERLWDGSFYKAAHTLNCYRKLGSWELQSDSSYKSLNEITVKDNLPENDVKELIGYLPWAVKLAPPGRDSVFNLLKDEKVFKATTGFASADISHERFLYERPHECLWNGYVWPFATSQTINAVISLLNNYKQDTITNKDLYDFIKTFAKMHYIYKDGKKINFIDEMMHPFKHEWSTRDTLRKLGWPKNKGGYERGKDYNHSSFIDLVIRGLCGVDDTSSTLKVNPRIYGIWKWFKLELPFNGKKYNIYYDEDGTYFNKGKGVIIEAL